MPKVLESRMEADILFQIAGAERDSKRMLVEVMAVPGILELLVASK